MQQHNSTRPSLGSVVTGPGREKPPEGLTDREVTVWLGGYDAGRRDASKAAHPAGLYAPTHGGRCG